MQGDTEKFSWRSGVAPRETSGGLSQEVVKKPQKQKSSPRKQERTKVITGTLYLALRPSPELPEAEPDSLLPELLTPPEPPSADVQ